LQGRSGLRQVIQPPHWRIIGQRALPKSRKIMGLAKKSRHGPVHKTPPDLRRSIESEPTTHAAWKSLTPLARNEWACWVLTAKLSATRSKRIQRTVEDLNAGKRRPCCWPGCPHRRPAARKWFEPHSRAGRA
jgi:hypothetical protein